VRVARNRRLVGLLTLVAVLAIGVGVSGFELPVLRLGGGGGGQAAPLAGVHAIAASVLLRVGAGAPQGSELAFMAVEPGGNLVISDSKRHTVMRFDPTGHLLSEWGPRLGDTLLGEPAGVAVQGDKFYVLDRGTTPRIFQLDATGRLQLILNLESFGTYGLNGLAVDRGGNLYAADTGRNRILVLAPDGSLVRQIGHSGADLGGLTQPMMLAFAADGSFVVADWENTRLERWDASFEATDVWTTASHPFGVAIDQIGRIYVPDTDHRRVQAYSAQGALLGEMGAAGSPTIDVAPKQVAVARSDQPSLYVLGSDGVVRLDLENTAPPPQGGSDLDAVSLIVIGLLVAMVGLAIVSRRSRRAANAPAVSGFDLTPAGLRTHDLT
jgi:DNA-binding beta-propeller fold protein YncE